MPQPVSAVTDAQGQKNIPVIPRSEVTWESFPFAEASLPIGWAGTGDADRRTSGGGHRLRNDTWQGSAVWHKMKKQNRPRRFAKDDAETP